eukprot:7491888-Ditylum_brightwellii.AAC.1
MPGFPKQEPWYVAPCFTGLPASGCAKYLFHHIHKWKEEMTSVIPTYSEWATSMLPMLHTKKCNHHQAQLYSLNQAASSAFDKMTKLQEQMEGRLLKVIKEQN